MEVSTAAAPDRSDEVASDPGASRWQWATGAAGARRMWTAFAVGSVLIRTVAVADGWAVERWGSLAQWSSHPYLNVAEHGYAVGSDVTLPAYPFLVRALTWVTGDRITTAVLVTYLCGAAATLLLDRWLVLRGFGATARRHAVLLFLAFPTSFVLYGVVGSEAMCLALVLGAMVLLEEDRPLLAGAVASVAAVTHPAGVALILVLAWTAASAAPVARDDGDRRSSVVRRASAVALATVLPIAFSAYCAVRLDDAFAAWNTRTSLAGLAAGLDSIGTWARIGWLRDADPLTWQLSRGVQTALLYGFLALVPLVWRKVSAGAALIVLGASAVTLASVQDPAGFARPLASASFPVVVLLTTVLDRRPTWQRWVVTAASLVLSVVAYACFVRAAGLPYW